VEKKRDRSKDKKRDRTGQSIRSIDRDQDWSGLYVINKCSYLGCETAPRHGKPFCLHHIRRMPYVAKLLPEIEADYASDEYVNRRKYLRALKEREAQTT